MNRDGAMNTADALAALEEADFHADAQDRRIRLDIKRRLKLAGLESDLAAINDITVLRQLLIQQVSYQEGQRVEVQLPQANDWREGSIEGVNVRYAEEDFDRVAVKLWDGSTYCALPERVRPAEEESPLWEAVRRAAETLSEPYDPGPAPWNEPDIDDGPDYAAIETDAGDRLDPVDPEAVITADEIWRQFVREGQHYDETASTEAVAQAAETIRAPEDEALTAHLKAFPEDSTLKSMVAFRHGFRAAEAQKNARATDLETSRLLCGRLADVLEVALSAIESLDFTVWELCGHDSEAYREATGVPSLADAAGAIREALRKAGRE